MLQQLVGYKEVDRKRKLEDEEIEKLLLGDDDKVDEPAEDVSQQSGDPKRVKTSPPRSQIFRKSKFSRPAREKWLLGGKDEDAEQCGSSKELEQVHLSFEPGEVKFSAAPDISSEQVGSETDIVTIIFTWSGWKEQEVGPGAPKIGFQCRRGRAL